jgi:RHS repeat-associated protein
MVYDGDLVRSKREEGASTAKYLWDGAQVLMETDGSDDTQARYTLAPFGYGDLVSQRRGDDSRFFHFDAIGTTRALTDADQAVTDSYIHRAFGTYVSTAGDTLNYFRYIGKLGYYQDYASPDGGFYVRRRYYAAGLGRFLSRDPVDETGVGEYAYVRNRVTRRRDPSGLQWWWKPIVGIWKKLPSWAKIGTAGVAGAAATQLCHGLARTYCVAVPGMTHAQRIEICQGYSHEQLPICPWGLAVQDPKTGVTVWCCYDDDANKVAAWDPDLQRYRTGPQF